MAPNIVFAPNIRRTQNTDTGRKTQTQLISALHLLYSGCSKYVNVNKDIQGHFKFLLNSLKWL